MCYTLLELGLMSFYFTPYNETSQIKYLTLEGRLNGCIMYSCHISGFKVESDISSF